jgi:hypothetical protein
MSPWFEEKPMSGEDLLVAETDLQEGRDSLPQGGHR